MAALPSETGAPPAGSAKPVAEGRFAHGAPSPAGVTDPASRALRDLLDAGLSSLFDPHSIEFRGTDEVGVRPVRSACQATAGEPVRLRHPLNRNAFLCGCLDFTEDEPVEHVIAGFGRRHGKTSRIEAIAHRLGSADHVDIGPDVWEAVRRWLAGTSRGEVLLVHNHPPNVLNRFFDNLPLASATDRDTWLGTLLRGGGLRFFLVENRYVRELRTPPLLRLLERLATVQEKLSP